MSIELITFLLFGSLILFLLIGVPLAYALGGTAIIFMLAFWGQPGFGAIVSSVLGLERTILFIALPLFIFMGMMLERSGLAEALYNAMYKWLGRLKGGLAAGTVAICTIFAAMAGLSGPAMVSMGLIGLPSMISRNYDKKLAMGSIMAGGALGTLIPPSAMMIVYGFVAQESVGRLFAGGILPGLLLASMFIAYILIISRLRPHMAPPLPPEERVNFKQKAVALRAVILPIFLVTGVLGAIFTGFATPTEAAAIGAFGSLICAVIYKRLTWSGVKQASYRTLGLTGMIMWIVIGAAAFTKIYTYLGANEFIEGLLTGMDVAPIVVVIIMQLIFLVLGCFLDPVGIIMITIPIFAPIIESLGFDGIWFGVVFVVNMEMAYLTPPLGFNLFYMKGVAPEGTRMIDIYKSAAPFILIQAITLIIVIAFPQIVTLIPNMLFGD